MLIHEVAKLLNVSTRTIRYYEQLNLIEVTVHKDNGYRSFQEKQIEQLRQIIYYRSLNIPLKSIRTLLQASTDQIKVYLKGHLNELEQQQVQLNKVIEHLNSMIKHLEADIMSEKFEQQKNDWIEKNEQQYGGEIRQRHGEESVMASYGKIKEMTEEQQQAAEQMQHTLFERLTEAMKEETNELLLEIAEVHKRWLSFYWPKYTKEAHVGLAQMYMMDERFTAYYDQQVGDGATQLLYEAILLYSKQ